MSRLISSQKERDFVNTNYDDIKQVFSIWICMNMNMNQNCMNYVHLTNDRLLGSYEWEGKIDLLGIVLIGLSKDLPEHDEKYELHRLFGALLSRNLSSDEKLRIIETEYDIPIEGSIRRDVSVMCNLSQGIREDANAEFIMSMYKKGYTLEQIADVAEKSIEEIKTIIERRKPILV